MEKITVLEKGQKLEFSFEDLLKYHGVGSVSYTHL